MVSTDGKPSVLCIGFVILIAHSVRFESGAEVIRIISARKADSKERHRYEHG